MRGFTALVSQFSHYRIEVVNHKTFHRYTVRAKRGTAQGMRDSQGNAPKSAGASIRRHNEAALAQVRIYKCDIPVWCTPGITSLREECRSRA